MNGLRSEMQVIDPIDDGQWKEQDLDQVAVVTGGGRGIGAGVAKALVKAGARVGLVGRNVNALRETANKLGNNAAVFVGDVTRAADMRAAMAGIEEHFGPIDLLVNNAGVAGTAADIAEIDPADWWRTQEINVLGVLHATQAALSHMLPQGQGRIVHMGSLAGNSAGPGVSDYSVSKTALLRLNESLAAEIGPKGLVSIAVSPGWVWTDMTDHFVTVFRETREDWSGVDQSTVFEPEAVADLIIRIALGDADALNGRFIHVKEDLDVLLTDVETIRRDDLLRLRVRNLPTT